MLIFFQSLLLKTIPRKRLQMYYFINIVLLTLLYLGNIVLKAAVIGCQRTCQRNYI